MLRSVGGTPFDSLLIAAGRIPGMSIVNKFGRNPDVDTATVPEDIWNGGGTYTGFPTGSPEEFQVYSSSASDTGTLSFSYLASNTATAYSTCTVTLNGTTQVNTGCTGYRVHTAQYTSGSETTFNVGTITIRHRTTTANVFISMPIGTSQSYMSGYTVPFGHRAVIKRFFVRVIPNVSGTVEGALWVRTNGGTPRLRRPFGASNTDHFEENVYSGVPLPANTDVIVRITASSANSVKVYGGYDLILIKE